ncbi:MAG: DUF3169 family protein [Lachnospiraceae bacterium]|nr:DUF3169 family protein [Lachnospiraceae bacterium]
MNKELKNNIGTVNKEEENKQQNKKAKGLFVIVMILSVLFGAVVGFCAKNLSVDMETLTPILANAVTKGLGVAAPFIMIVLFVVNLIYVCATFSKCKKRWEAEKDTNDDIYDVIDAKLTNILSVIQIYTVVSYFLFSVAFYYAVHVMFSIWFLIALVVFIIDMVLILGYQRKTVDFVKIMNPEKQGSVYDLKFREKWMDSCDELEKQIIWQCGYKAYQVANGMCLLLWTVFTGMAMFLKISLWPVAIVSLFWLVLTATYLAEGRKLEQQMKK